MLWKATYQNFGQPRRKVKLLESHNFPRLNYEEIETSNKPVANTEIEKEI